MDFNQVRYFLALAVTLNFTRAAEQCHVAQPTLTQAIKRLEDELGGPLILREGKYSRLTTLGRTLRAHFEKIDSARRALKDSALALAAGDAVELNIGLMCTIGPKMLAGFLDEFQRMFPSATLFLHDVTPDAIAELLLSGALDGAFSARHDAKHERLEHQLLYEEAMVVAFPPGHPFAEMSAVPLDVIARHRYLDRLHCEFRSGFARFAETQRVSFDVAFASQREDWIQDMVRGGSGVSILPEYSLLAPVIEHRPVIDPVLTRSVEFVTVYGGPKPAALRSLIDQAKAYPWMSAAKTGDAGDQADAPT